MKILFVTPPCHFRNAGAAQKDVYALSEHFMRLGHSVTVYSIDSPALDKETLFNKGKQLGFLVKTFMPNRNMSERFGRILKNFAFFDGAADVFAQLIKDKTFKDYVENEKPALVFGLCSYSWPVLKFATDKGIPSVFRSHNFEASFFWEEISFGKKFYPFNWLRVLAKYMGERNAVIHSTATATLPFVGMRWYHMWKKSGIYEFPIIFSSLAIRGGFVHKDKKPLDVFYLGASYNVVFHLRGAKLLIEEIIPKVLEREPGVFRFHICGGKLPQYLQDKCDGKNLIYEGYVDDFEEFMARMDIGAFPVFTGSTIKGKIVESLCRAFPSVLTKNCLGMYDLKDGREVIIRNNIPDFIDGIIMMKDDKLRYKLSMNTAEFSKREFHPDVIENKLREIFKFCQDNLVRTK